MLQTGEQRCGLRRFPRPVEPFNDNKRAPSAGRHVFSKLPSVPQEQSSERSDEVEMNRRSVLVRLQVQGSRAIVPSAPDSHGRVCQMRPFLLLQVILEQPYRPLPSDRKHVICKLLQRLRQDTRYPGVSTFIGLLQYVHRRPWPLPPHFTK